MHKVYTSGHLVNKLTSNGAGIKSNTVIHAVMIEDFTNKRFTRKKGELACRLTRKEEVELSKTPQRISCGQCKDKIMNHFLI